MFGKITHSENNFLRFVLKIQSSACNFNFFEKKVSSIGLLKFI